MRRILYCFSKLKIANQVVSPIRTFNTAVVYYHKFRLVHPDNEYNYMVLPTSCPLLYHLTYC